tara:strand:- start:58 stop:417 length:360 start_codon:yes stop_codon:yes gene_type:complete
MKKSSLNYSVLSKKELEFLKDTYIQDKVKSMSEKELKNFVFECINHQIKNTIGNEEESEAWREMESFYDNKFEELILKIQTKFKAYSDPTEEIIEDHERRSKLLETNKIDNEKKDMWDD